MSNRNGTEDNREARFLLPCFSEYTLRNDAEVQVDIAMKRRAGEVKAWGMAVEEELRRCGGGCRCRWRRQKCLEMRCAKAIKSVEEFMTTLLQAAASGREEDLMSLQPRFRLFFFCTFFQLIFSNFLHLQHP